MRPAELPRYYRHVVAHVARAVAPAYPPLQERDRRTVHEDVVRFVTAQVAALPDFLRWPYELAMIAFDTFPILRRGRRFVALPPERQAAWVAAWSDARLAPMRNFVKLMRSCALLAYYDHPAVRAALLAPPQAAGGDGSATSDGPALARRAGA